MKQSPQNTSQWQRYALLALLGACVLGTVFGAGFFVGRWSARRDLSGASPLRRFIPVGRHGAIGTVVQIEGTTITIQSRDGATQSILTDSQTRIERGATKTVKLTLDDLKVRDQIIVVGTPNAQGQIKANLIRVLPMPVLTPTPTGL